MKDKKLRKIIFKHNARINKLKLSARRADIIAHIVNEGETGSSDISRVFDVSLQSISTTLGALHKLGYLKRREIVSLSGGKEYLYRAARGVE